MSKVKRIVEGADWQTYEDRVLAAISEAVQKYSGQFADSPEEKVSQVSIWTDVQVLTSAVSFETASHVRQRIDWARSRGQDDMADTLEGLGYNGNPADFKYAEYFTTKHPELEDLQELDFGLTTHKRTAEARAAASLRRVARRVGQENMLAGLPHEEVVWLGISSPRDWYDHMQKLSFKE